MGRDFQDMNELSSVAMTAFMINENRFTKTAFQFLVWCDKHDRITPTFIPQINTNTNVDNLSIVVQVKVFFVGDVRCYIDGSGVFKQSYIGNIQEQI